MSFCACLTEIMEGGFKNAIIIKIDKKSFLKDRKLKLIENEIHLSKQPHTHSLIGDILCPLKIKIIIEK